MPLMLYGIINFYITALFTQIQNVDRWNCSCVLFSFSPRKLHHLLVLLRFVKEFCIYLKTGSKSQ